MSEPKMNFDRYHATQGNFSLTKHAIINGEQLADKKAVFYVTQRKFPFVPCVGHERLLEDLHSRSLDVPRLRFLRQDKANLSLLTERLSSANPHFVIRTVKPGTIVFAGEPFADIKGPFAETQLKEVCFEHAFDMPMTVAGNALKIRLAAGNRWVSDFSLRRDGSVENAVEATRYSYIGGFNDTSNMEAAFLLDVNATGTMAHYLIQAFHELQREIVKPTLDEKGRRKHFQEVCFERWLDAHPQGTTLLLDTFSLEFGTIHAIRAAKSSPERKAALKAVRIDSGDLVIGAKWVQAMLDANDLKDVKIILTSDLDDKSIKEIVTACPFVYGFGVGTKLLAETQVAGVIFKLAKIGRQSTLKCSGTKGKETIPAQTQVWRCTDKDGFYIKDVIALIEETGPRSVDFNRAIPLLEPFYDRDGYMVIPSTQSQKDFVDNQLKKFKNIQDYKVELSPLLQGAKNNIIKYIFEDETGTDGVTIVD